MFEHKPIYVVSDLATLSSEITDLTDKGGRVYYIAGKDLRTKADLLIAIEDAMELPDYFGRNWDALDEVLREPDFISSAGCVLVLDEPEGLITNSKEDFRVFLDIVIWVWGLWLCEGVVFGLAVQTAEPARITGSYPDEITSHMVTR